MPKVYRKKRPRRNYGSYLNTAQKALKTALMVKKLVNVEHKLCNLGGGHNPTLATPVITNLCQIAQGDTQTSRSGNSIKMSSMAWRYTVKLNASATQSNYRFLIIRDNQQVSDTTPTVSDIFKSNSTYGVNSVLNELNLGRFSIVHDDCISLSSTGTQNVNRQGYKKLDNHVRFNGSASTDIQKGGYYMVSLSDEATNSPAMSYYFRSRFIDN